MTAAFRFSTGATEPQHRSSKWNTVVSEAYFPLELQFRDPVRFNGELARAELGHVGMSRLTSDPVNYERRRSHIRNAQEEEYLVTLPRATSVEFRQMGRDVRCDPGGFIIERGDEPYRFLYERPNDLYVLKVSRRALPSACTVSKTLNPLRSRLALYMATSALRMSVSRSVPCSG